MARYDRMVATTDREPMVLTHGELTTGPAEAVRLVDRQCLLLVRVHDRIAALPPV